MDFDTVSALVRLLALSFVPGGLLVFGLRLALREYRVRAEGSRCWAAAGLALALGASVGGVWVTWELLDAFWAGCTAVLIVTIGYVAARL